uniref:Uncharacterized protein n=1 Tax=Arundo donax TaxID=35708 RepID=A0A0A9DZQ3_ARUDO
MSIVLTTNFRKNFLVQAFKDDITSLSIVNGINRIVWCIKTYIAAL